MSWLTPVLEDDGTSIQGLGKHAWNQSFLKNLYLQVQTFLDDVERGQTYLFLCMFSMSSLLTPESWYDIIACAWPEH